MQGIATTIRLVDQMTAPIMSITNSIDNLVNQFNAVENASDIDTTSLDAMRSQVSEVTAYVEQLNQTYDSVGDTINQMTHGQEGFNKSVRQGSLAADSLVKKIGALVATYASIQAGRSVLGLSDELTETTARLNRMNDGLQTTQDLQNMIYLAAQRSRGEYQTTLNTVSKLGTMAREAFSSNVEIIAFSEQLNKQFRLAGTNTDGIKNAMLQLTQAMGSGVLRGDELNSIFEQAPIIIQTIADYLDVPIGQIRDMAQEGEITANIVKVALLSAAEETNAAFENIPMTFGQIATSMKNRVLMLFQPILNRLNEIANSPAFQTLTDNIVGAFIVVAGVVLEIFDLIAAIGQFAADNWSWLAPIIYTAVAAMTAYVAILTVYNTIQAISNGLKAMATFQARAKAAAELQASGATLTAAQSQTIFNAALLACPLTWILIAIIAIIGAIYLVIGIINKAAGTSISATGIIFGAFTTLGAFLWNLFLGLFELVLGVINALINPFVDIANFIGNVFFNPVSSIIYLFQGMADTVLGILQKIASALDFVFGSNMADTVADWRSGLKGMADAAVAEYAPNEDYQGVMDNLDLSVEGLGLKRWAYGDAWNTGYTAGEVVDETIANFDPASLFGTNIPDASAYGGGAFDFTNMENNLENIDANTKGQLDYSEEELKLWRDIAERDTINRFTTAEVTVEFGDVNNNVSSNVDLDGIADYIGERVEETLYEVAEGVHD